MRTTIIVTFIMALGLVVSDVYAGQNQSAPVNTFVGVPCDLFNPAATAPQAVTAPTNPDALTIVPIATDLGATRTNASCTRGLRFVSVQDV